MTRSSKRMPKASSRSASWMAVLTQASPCMPIMPRFSGWLAGMPPRPSSVIAIGVFVRSANWRTSSVAPDSMMPWPARMTGRFASLISAAACRIRPAPGGGPGGSRAARRGGLPVEFARALLRVLGDVDEHRAGPAGRRDVECLANRRRDVVGARHQVVVLGDGQRDARDVGLLEGVGANQLAADLSR